MSRESVGLTPGLQHYVQSVSVRETAALAGLRTATAELDDAFMQIAPEQGQAMYLLLRLMGARRVLEIGTYTGYSTLWMAHALPEDGEVVACDVDTERPAIGRPYWQQDGMDSRISLRVGPALDTMDALLDAGEAATFDFIFIDADKESYDAYYERGLQLLRRGGAIGADNTLWSGTVIESDKTDEMTEAIRAFNAKVGRDSRVEQALIPVGDGLTIARRP